MAKEGTGEYEPVSADEEAGPSNSKERTGLLGSIFGGGGGNTSPSNLVESALGDQDWEEKAKEAGQQAGEWAQSAAGYVKERLPELEEVMPEDKAEKASARTFCNGMRRNEKEDQLDAHHLRR